MFYRLHQLTRALTGRVSATERVLVAAQLSPAELRLFTRMPRFDQRHCLDVFHTLARVDHADPLLLHAALLHDCGKVDARGRAIPLLFYGLFVVLQRLAPGVYARAARDGRGMLWPFAAHAAHEARSAQLAQDAGSPPALVAILRDVAARRDTAATRALRWADEQC